MRHSVILGLLLATSGAMAQNVTQPPAGRLLASNCFQCHGTNGSGGFERLAGMSAREVVSEMREMRSDSSPDIMDVHARGYTDAQLQLIGNYFASLKSSTTTNTSASTSTSSDSSANTKSKFSKEKIDNDD